MSLDAAGMGLVTAALALATALFNVMRAWLDRDKFKRLTDAIVKGARSLTDSTRLLKTQGQLQDSRFEQALRILEKAVQKL